MRALVKSHVSKTTKRGAPPLGGVQTFATQMWATRPDGVARPNLRYADVGHPPWVLPPTSCDSIRSV
jgi:hypothetical protein